MNTEVVMNAIGLIRGGRIANPIMIQAIIADIIHHMFVTSPLMMVIGTTILMIRLRAWICFIEFLHLRVVIS